MFVDDILNNITIDQQIVLIVLASVLLLQFLFYLIVLAQPVYRKVKHISRQVEQSVSVIICAKNELENLRKFLPKVLEQEYKDYEVIVVDDCSEDETEMFLADLEQKHKHLRHTTIEADMKFSHGKKLAVTIGIKSAKNDHLVFIDADCYPESKNWLQEIMSGYDDNIDIVLGYGKYDRQKGLLNRIIRFDTLMIGMHYLGLAIIGKPYMGVGRNLSYKKQFFFEGRGFGNHYHVLSGDDDLFINEHSTKKNTAVAISKDSFTSSVPPQSVSEWVRQKKRHLSTAKYYKIGDKLILGFEPFSRLIFYLSIIYLAFTPVYLLAIAAYGLRLLIQLIVMKLGMNKFSEKGFLLLIPLLDIFIPVFQLSLIFSNKINAKNRKWN